jgi:hypothetical protein
MVAFHAARRKAAESAGAETLTYCAAHGGHCDCEIIFNVDPGKPDNGTE